MEKSGRPSCYKGFHRTDWRAHRRHASGTLPDYQQSSIVLWSE